MGSKKKVLKMAGKWDGNAFAVMGNTKKALKEAGVPDDKIKQTIEDCTNGDYTHLLATCMEALREAGYEIR